MTIGIIGYGQVSQAFINQQFVLDNLKYIVIRNGTDRINFTNFVNQNNHNITIYSEVNQIINFAEFNLILVNDSNIINVVDQLVDCYAHNNEPKTTTSIINSPISNSPNIKPIFAHFSGVLNLDVLKKLQENRYKIAKLHPFQTFAIINKNIDNENNINIFKDVAFLCEFDIDVQSSNSNEERELENILRQFIESLDAKFFNKNELQNFDEKLYHIIAVLSSNYLTTYLKLIIDLAENSGLNKDFLLPIINTTIKNIFEKERSGDNYNNHNYPLSGPIARLDFITIEKHLQILKDKNINFGNELKLKENDLLEFYTFFGKITTQLALKNGIFEVGDFDKLKKIFEK